MQTMFQRIIRPVTMLLSLLFLISASLNLGLKIPLGFAELSFALPSTVIAEFEIAIGVVLLASALISNPYLFGGAYLFAVVGIVEGLLSSNVKGLARIMHEAMVPLAIFGIVLLILDVRNDYKTRKYRIRGQTNQEIVTVLQFFVGGLVTLGGAAYTKGGTYPVETALGLVHLSVGLTGLYGGYSFLRKKTWSAQFLIGVNSVTIVYSAFSESLAEVYAFLPPGINDALIGTIIAIIVSAMIIYLLLQNKSEISQLQRDQQTNMQI